MKRLEQAEEELIQRLDEAKKALIEVRSAYFELYQSAMAHNAPMTADMAHKMRDRTHEMFMDFSSRSDMIKSQLGH